MCSSMITIKKIVQSYDKKRGTKDTRGTVKHIYRKLTDNAMAKSEKDEQTNNSTHDTT